ncbi:hypothetical protein [Ferruginibacter sp.]
MKKLAFVLLLFVFKNTASLAQDNNIISLDTTTADATVNWPALKQVLISCNNMQSLCGNDSVEYSVEVFYSTLYKTAGFNRTAIKRVKGTNKWYYESFLKINTDSNKIKDIYAALYNQVNRAFTDYCGDDFSLATSARRPISAPFVTWLAQWSLFSKYQSLPEGLGNLKMGLILSGSDDVLKPGTRKYLIKIYIYNTDVKYDVLNWDKPL